MKRIQLLQESDKVAQATLRNQIKEIELLFIPLVLWHSHFLFLYNKIERTGRSNMLVDDQLMTEKDKIIISESFKNH